jgi:SPX domain protein involved in polyphosphate accumulation
MLNPRYERKFMVEGIHPSEAEAVIFNHPSLFTEIFQERSINNIYFDTDEDTFFRDNVIGTSKRRKIRIRWYGDMFGSIAKPTLEYKLKDALVGDKWSFKTKSFTLDSAFSMKAMKEVVNASDVPDFVKEDFKHLKPALLNQYVRRYFLSADGKFRVTLDFRLNFWEIFSYDNDFFHHIEKKNKLIVELKYGIDSDKIVHKISSAFPFRMTKSSKYVDGVAELRGLEWY